MESTSESKGKRVKSEHKKVRSHKPQKTSSAPSSSSLALAAPSKPEEVETEDWDANRVRVEALCAEYPNNVCNDCNETGTRWAAVNFGVFVCIRCAGVHRSLGTHVSKVKSTNMDKWAASEVALMEAVGNTRGKALYESHLATSSNASVQPLTGSEPEDVVTKFIARKYVDWAFASDKAPRLLRRLQKQVGYGAIKQAGEGHRGTTLSSEMPSEVTPPAEEMRAQRQRLLQGLYGQDQLPSSRTSAGKEGKGDPTQSEKMRRGAASQSQPTVHGTFGVVNVHSDVYDAHLLSLLTAFGCAPPATLAPAATAVAETGVAEGSRAVESRT